MDSKASVVCGVIAGALAVAACGGPPAPTVPYPPDALVLGDVEVLDGDTLTSDDVTYRLAGINANEVAHGWGTVDECLAPEAGARLRDLVAPGAAVVASGEDRYGRILADAIAGDGTYVNLALVLEGFALAETFGDPGPNAAALAAAEADARLAGLGLWSPLACGAEPGPHVGLQIVADDAGGEPGEHAVISGAPGVDLRGYVLRDGSASHRLVFPPGTAIPAGGELVVESGCDSPLDGIVHWCAATGVWNDAGDRGFLLGPAGNIVAMAEY